MRLLVNRHAPRLRACALRMLEDESLADEIVQDVFMIMLRGAPGFRRDANLGTWLYAIALNRCRNMRARRRSTAGAVDAQVPDPAPDPHTRSELVERQERLARAMSVLSEESREVIVLRFAGGRSYEEIAEIHGCAIGTVASRLHRALKQLGQVLKSQGLTRETI
jgi:RNA polymerase sigma-70 factor (ECF subfamily)